MISGIIAAIAAFFQSIPIIARYFPPKSAIEKQIEADANVDDEIKKIKNDGRP